MFTKIHWIHQFENSARIGIMARPRGGEWLDDEIAQFQKQKVGTLVSLLEKSEIQELGLSREEAICKSYQIDFINFPIPDRDVPKNKSNVDTLLKNLKEKLTTGTSIVIHCRMGIGRSSIIAAAVLLDRKTKSEDLFRQISKARGLKVPDTDGQVKWLKERE